MVHLRDNLILTFIVCMMQLTVIQLAVHGTSISLNCYTQS
jgi:hypothetical protein